MADFDDQLERMQADGRITPHDADEVRRFADFLTAMADTDVRPAKPGERRTPEAAAKARDIYLEHYLEHAPQNGAL